MTATCCGRVSLIQFAQELGISLAEVGSSPERPAGRAHAVAQGLGAHLTKMGLLTSIAGSPLCKGYAIDLRAASAAAACRLIAVRYSMQAIISPPKAWDQFCFAAETQKLLRENPESSMLVFNPRPNSAPSARRRFRRPRHWPAASNLPMVKKPWNCEVRGPQQRISLSHCLPHHTFRRRQILASV